MWLIPVLASIAIPTLNYQSKINNTPYISSYDKSKGITNTPQRIAKHKLQVTKSLYDIFTIAGVLLAFIAVFILLIQYLVIGVVNPLSLFKK